MQLVREPYKQWVIEDDFIESRPAWETVGAQFVANVAPYEKMKLSLLNAGHSVLGILGALVGYDTIDEAVNNQHIKAFLNAYMDVEVTPVLGELEGIDLKTYKRLLLERFGNTNIKDQINRICSESSAKIPIFMLPTVHSELDRNGSIDLAAFVIAAWAIYNLGKDGNGRALKIKDTLKSVLNEKASAATDNPKVFLGVASVFGKLNESSIFVAAYIKAYLDITAYGVEKSISDIYLKK
jgi:mannitol 2-dehydrogenase